MPFEKGLTHFYFGGGKGKTTAAMGLAARVLGRGGRVVIVQFLKDGESGEMAFFSKQKNVTLFSGKSGGFSFNMTGQQKAETAGIHAENFKRAAEIAVSGGCDLLVLDECADAVQTGLFDEKMLCEFLKAKPYELELVITGHKPLRCILAASDYVTEMKKHKHPYDAGVAAREGIEL